MITTIYFVRHAQPEYENHDDMSRPLSDKGQIDKKRVTDFFAISTSMQSCPVPLRERWIQLMTWQKLKAYLFKLFRISESEK